MYAVHPLKPPGTYPFDASRLSTGSALTAAHFCQTATKVSKKALPLAYGLRCAQVPSCRLAPWARRHGPSLAHRGSPGIHAGRPTAQNLHSASRWGGRSKSTARARARARARSRSRSRSTIFRFQGGVTDALKIPTGIKHYLAWAAERLSVTYRSAPWGWSCPIPYTGRPAMHR